MHLTSCYCLLRRTGVHARRILLSLCSGALSIAKEVDAHYIPNKAKFGSNLHQALVAIARHSCVWKAAATLHRLQKPL